jgi:hypothetical protein
MKNSFFSAMSVARRALYTYWDFLPISATDLIAVNISGKTLRDRSGALSVSNEDYFRGAS